MRLKAWGIALYREVFRRNGTITEPPADLSWMHENREVKKVGTSSTKIKLMSFERFLRSSDFHNGSRLVVYFSPVPESDYKGTTRIEEQKLWEARALKFGLRSRTYADHIIMTRKGGLNLAPAPKLPKEPEVTTVQITTFADKEKKEVLSVATLYRNKRLKRAAKSSVPLIKAAARKAFRPFANFKLFRKKAA